MCEVHKELRPPENPNIDQERIHEKLEIHLKKSSGLLPRMNSFAMILAFDYVLIFENLMIMNVYTNIYCAQRDLAVMISNIWLICRGFYVKDEEVEE